MDETNSPRDVTVNAYSDDIGNKWNDIHSDPISSRWVHYGCRLLLMSSL